MKKIITTLILCVVLSGFSQEDKIENSLFTIRGNVGIPRVFGSQTFRTCFAGLYEGNLSVNIRLIRNFFVGVGYQNTQFKNNEFLKYQYFNASIPYNTRLLSSGTFIKVGYDKFFSDKFYATVALNSGLMFNHYTNVNADTSKSNKPFGLISFSAPYVQPEIDLNFIIEKHLALCIILSHTTQFTKFDPKAPRFAQFQEVKDTRNRYFMNWINVGFGFNILINTKTKA